MRVGRRKAELELARAQPDHQSAYGDAAKVEDKLACASLDSEREGSFLAELYFVARYASEGGSDPLEGGFDLRDRNARPFSEDPGEPSVGRVVANTRDPGLALTGSSLEAACTKGYPQAWVFGGGVGDVYGVSPI